MKDYWNDPPDEDFLEQACPRKGCDGAGEYIHDADNEDGMVYKCDTCDHQWVVPIDVEGFIKELDEEFPDWDEYQDYNPLDGLCPHGNEWGSCAICDREGDLAYDAAREKGK